MRPLPPIIILIRSDIALSNLSDARALEIYFTILAWIALDIYFAGLAWNAAALEI